MDKHADLQLFIRRIEAHYFADLWVDLPFTRFDLKLGVPLKIDSELLLGLTSSPHDYGEVLTSMIFPQPLQTAWQRVSGWCDAGGAARFRLMLDPGDEHLHSLRWELICDPLTREPFASSERFLFSRYLGSDTLRDCVPPALPDLRAVVAVANPAGSSLPPINVTEEVNRAVRGLGTIPAIILDGLNGRPAPSIPEITAALRTPAQLLIIVCHGKMVRNSRVIEDKSIEVFEPFLWLAQEDESSKPVAGSAFVQAMTKLPQPPLLIVLAACEGAGVEDQVLAAIGPQLAHKGIAAVLAMRDSIPQATVDALLPRFFTELQRDGQIDRALAVARASLGRYHPTWAPVLWMRVRDGRLWRPSTPQSEPLPARPVPGISQVSAPVAEFIDRTDELARVVKMLRVASATRPAVCAVCGIGGIGKTQLALAAAAQLKEDFPDAHLVVSLRASTRDPLSITQALRHCISAFDQQARLPDDADELAAIYRQKLANKRVLVLADDAGESDKLKLLVPPAGSALLITSRYHLPFVGSSVIDLRVLPFQAAVGLVHTLCPEIGEHSGRLVELCGALPLALNISANLLASNVTLRPEAFVENLANERERFRALQLPGQTEESVTAVLTASYSELGTTSRIALNQCAVFAGSFDREAARAVVLLPDADVNVDSILSDLYRCSVIEYDRPTDRFALHSLVQAFALSQGGDEDAVRLRHARHYIDVARRAEEGYLSGSAKLTDSLALFDRERQQIDAVWNWLQRRTPAQETDELLVSLAQATVHTGNLRYNKRTARISQLKAVAAAAKRLGRRAQEGRVLNNLGEAWRAIGEVAQARMLHDQALAIARAEGDTDAIANALASQAGILADQEAYDAAVERYREALEIKRSLGELRGEAAIHLNLGHLAAEQDKTEQAIDSYEAALALRRRLGDRRGEAVALIALGAAYANQSKNEASTAAFEQALAITRELRDRSHEAATLGNLANLMVLQGNDTQAEAYYITALDIQRELGDRQGEAYSSWELGQLMVRRGEIEQAIPFLQVCVDYEQATGHPRAECDAAHLDALRKGLLASKGGYDDYFTTSEQ